MGLFQRHQPSAAGAWRAGVDHPLDLDLDRHAVAGIALRDPAALLWKLGPADDPAAAANGFFDFTAAGVAAETLHGRVTVWRVLWRDPEERFAPFAGPCRYHGTPVDLHAGLEERLIVQLFGDPVWRDEQAGEVRLFYARQAVEWQFHCSAAHGLRGLVLSALPLYAGSTAPPSS